VLRVLFPFAKIYCSLEHHNAIRRKSAVGGLLQTSNGPV
jgi:hypothetical protein